MILERREFLAIAGSTLVAPLGLAGPGATTAGTGGAMYGLIGKITAVPGQRDALDTILLEGMDEMPGCLSYVVATDPTDADVLWITEVWDSRASHRASLELPTVQDAIASGRPLIEEFTERVETVPVGGHGLASSPRG